MPKRRLKFWGWGWEDQGPSDEDLPRIAAAISGRFGSGDFTVTPRPRLDELELPAPRIRPPAALAKLVSDDPYERARHSYGRSYRDVVRAYQRDFSAPPDGVAFPESEQEIGQLMDWCGSERVALIPYGGGSSVVGGVETRLAEGYRGVLSLDLSRLDQVLEVDATSRSARIQAGIYGPALEDALRPHGFTLRHFPQSFEFSTVGGWLATRSGGHFATRYTHIDDFVQSMRVLTPAGALESRRLPGSGAGPSPDRLFLGSEGILGVITEAWLRLQSRPTFRANASLWFPGFESGVQAVRALSQSGLEPSNCRILDPGEAAAQAGGDGVEALLLLAFESADHPLDAWLARGVELARDFGARLPDGATSGSSAAATNNSSANAGREGAAGAWRNSFIGAPYLRDAMVAIGVLSETFETAITWDRFPAFHAAVLERVRDAVERVCGEGTVTCRFTHVYPDGPAPYYTIMAPARRGGELEQWAEIKREASDAVLSNGGTITHHHAVGRDHRPGYDRQRPDAFALALGAAKQALDPAGILNPGVLIDPAVPADSKESRA